MFRITLVHPCLGRRIDEQKGLRSWQMQPLWAAALASTLEPDITLRFYDDRLEQIPFDETTDLVGISVETYTARRAYQIASEYRRRGVPVVMGGIHATLCPEEVSEYADSVVCGDGEETWPVLLEDARNKRLSNIYQSTLEFPLRGLRYRYDIFRGKRYLPIQLVEFGRGCSLTCEFCAVQSAFQCHYRRRPLDEVIAEVASGTTNSGRTKLIFFVDDNLACEPESFKEFLRALVPLGIRWAGQAGINVAHDPELLDLIVRSGCCCLLIGLESLQPSNLYNINKPINDIPGGIGKAAGELRRFHVPVYGTFIFGLDADSDSTFSETVDFSIEYGFLLAAFAHLMPFPGTPLYKRFADERRLISDCWWLEHGYKYNTVAFKPLNLTPEELRHRCLDARRKFFSWPSMLRRSLSAGRQQHNFWTANLLHRTELGLRDGHPLGDQSWHGPLLKVQ